MITNLNKPVENKRLADWDTTAIADGTYQLRLRVMLNDGNTLETIVPDLRVRNYTAVETSTPLVVRNVWYRSAIANGCGRKTAVPTPTAFPDNPAAVTQEDVLKECEVGSNPGGWQLCGVGNNPWIAKSGAKIRILNK